MNKFLEIFQEANGILSSNRVMFVYSGFLATSVWTITSLSKMAMQEVPYSVIVFIGSFIAGKVVQKFGETKGA